MFYFGVNCFLFLFYVFSLLLLFFLLLLNKEVNFWFVNVGFVSIKLLISNVFLLIVNLVVIEIG